MSETPTNEAIAKVLRNGARYLPRMALKDSPEAVEFHNAGDGIIVNEGDFWALLMYAQIAADRLDKPTGEITETQ